MADVAAACPDENTLSQLVEGRLQGDALAELEAHVDTCDLCAMLLADLAAVIAPASGHGAIPVRGDRFRITAELGSGAMGVVHAAFDTKLRRRVALKRIRPDLSFLNPSGARDARARLMREARLLAGVSHPNIVGLYDVETTADEIILVQELVEGRSVDAWLAEDKPAWREIVTAFEQAARGLQAAHRAGLVHRDVKPSNLLMGVDGRVRVSDFGLARLVSESRGSIGTEGASALTATGAIVGTPAYMAPEQFMGRMVDARSDQYGLAVALVEALVGERPLPGSTPEDLEAAAETNGYPPPERWVSAAACRALRPRPSERFADVGALADALRDEPVLARAETIRPAVEPSPPPAGRRRAPFVVGALVLGGGAALALSLARPWADAAPATSPTSAALVDSAPSVFAETPITAESALATAAPPPDPAPTATDPSVANIGASRGAPSASASGPLPADRPGTINVMIGARRHRDSGEGAACLADLDKLRASDPARLKRADAVLLRAECEMFDGRCDAGRSRLRTLLAGTYSGDALDDAIDATSIPKCKSTKAGAAKTLVSRDQANAVFTEAQAAADKGGVDECRNVAQKALALARPGLDPGIGAILHGAVHLANGCMIKGGDCTASRKSFSDAYPKLYPQLVALGVDEKQREEMFGTAYPACAGKP